MKLPFRKCPRSAAFTLVELLVVMGIIAILVSVIGVAAGSAIRYAKRTKASSTASQISTAVQNYYTEYGVYPVSGTTTTDDYYDGGAGGESKWSQLMIALCGNQNPYNAGTTVTSSVPNTRGIAYLSPTRSEIDSNGILVNPFDSVSNGTATGPSANSAPYFYMVVDTDYSGVVGDTGGNLPPDFSQATVGAGKAVAGGVAVWSPCDQALTGSKSAFWVHTY